MSVTVNIPQFLQHLAEDAKSIDVEGKTVGQCLKELVKRYPGVESVLFDDRGELLQLLNVYVNGESAYPGELPRRVKDGDRIDIMYTLVGG